MCVTRTTEGEGLTVGDKPGRPAHCDYHTPDALSPTHTRSLLHTCIHNGQRGSVLQGFRRDGRRDRRADRERSLGSRERWKPQQKQMNTDWKITMPPFMLDGAAIVFSWVLYQCQCAVMSRHTGIQVCVFTPEMLRLCREDMTSVGHFN